MRRYRFFLPPELAARAVGGRVVPLPEEEAMHATRVLRLRVGDAIRVFDGAGGEWEAKLAPWEVGVGKKGTPFGIELGDALPASNESPLNLVLAPALLKQEAFDLVLEKAVELGAHAFEPLLTERCVVKWEPYKAEAKLARWERLALEALKQCERRRVPAVREPRPFAGWLADARGVLVLCRERSDAATSLPAVLRRQVSSISASSPLYLLVGPEGGWSEADIDLARRHGCLEASLGERILRAETAAIAALAIAQATLGDLAS